MDLKIGTVAKMTGLSPSGIRFLEEEGIVSPDGGRNGKYRSYSMANVSELLDYRNYRKCGLSQEEIAQLFRSTGLQLPGDILGRHCDEIEGEIKEKIRLLHFLRGRYRDLELIARRENFYEITDRPAMIWLPLMESGKPSMWPEETGLEIPYTDSILLFDNDTLVQKRQWTPSLGIGMLESDISSISFLGRPELRYFGACRVLHCIVELGEDFGISREEALSVNARLNEAQRSCGIRVKAGGRTMSRRIISSKTGGRAVRYDHLWVEID